MNNAEFLRILHNNAKIINDRLAQKLLPIKEDASYEYIKNLCSSMEYSLLAGGKRIRPCLALEFAKLFGADESAAFDYACALEMIHTFSLIHDDMPCMDNDDMRRGKPTNHIVYGETTALLAGDALSVYAFETACNNALSDRQNIAALMLLAKCTGIFGMIGGQQIDLDSEGKNISGEILELLHRKKTGALISCACLLGCVAAGKYADSREYADALSYSKAIGLAFQIADDILDVVGDSEKLGKNCGSDEKENKMTYVTLYGLNGAKQKAAEQVNVAKAAISHYAGSEFLQCLADYIVQRDN